MRPGAGRAAPPAAVRVAASPTSLRRTCVTWSPLRNPPEAKYRPVMHPGITRAQHAARAMEAGRECRGLLGGGLLPVAFVTPDGQA